MFYGAIAAVVLSRKRREKLKRGLSLEKQRNLENQRKQSEMEYNYKKMQHCCKKGIYYFKKDDFNSAKKEFHNSIKYGIYCNKVIIDNYVKLGIIYLKQVRFYSALKYLNQAFYYQNDNKEVIDLYKEASIKLIDKLRLCLGDVNNLEKKIDDKSTKATLSMIKRYKNRYRKFLCDLKSIDQNSFMKEVEPLIFELDKNVKETMDNYYNAVKKEIIGQANKYYNKALDFEKNIDNKDSNKLEVYNKIKLYLKKSLKNFADAHKIVNLTEAEFNNRKAVVSKLEEICKKINKTERENLETKLIKCIKNLQEVPTIGYKNHEYYFKELNKAYNLLNILYKVPGSMKSYGKFYKEITILEKERDKVIKDLKNKVNYIIDKSLEYAKNNFLESKVISSKDASMLKKLFLGKLYKPSILDKIERSNDDEINSVINNLSLIISKKLHNEHFLCFYTKYLKLNKVKIQDFLKEIEGVFANKGNQVSKNRL